MGAIAGGSATEREAAYCAIERAVRAALAGRGDTQAGALAIACTRPLISSVLCAPASKVGEAESRRAGLLLYEMAKLEPIAVVGEAHRTNDEGVILMNSTWTAPGSVVAELLAMDPSDWTREHAITASTNMASHVPMWAAGCAAGIAPAGMTQIDWFTSLFAAPGFLTTPEPADRNAPLALLCLDLCGSRKRTRSRRALPSGPRRVCAGLRCTSLKSGKISGRRALWMFCQLCSSGTTRWSGSAGAT